MDLDADELLGLIGRGEGKELEFKRGLSPGGKIARVLCAFANTRGGLLLVGVGDRGEILGVPRPKQVIDELRSMAASVVPPLAVQVRKIGVAGHSIVCCSVPLSPGRPHRVVRPDGSEEVVIRAGSSNRAADGATRRAILTTRSRKGLTALEAKALAWIEGRARRARTPGGDATVAGFAKAHNVGVQRARKAFVELERAGRIVGHGPGARRIYSVA